MEVPCEHSQDRLELPAVSQESEVKRALLELLQSYVRMRAGGTDKLVRS